MSSVRTQVRWLVQTPPPGDDSPTLGLLRRACSALSLPLDTIEVIRGSPPTLPPILGPTCIHGRMTLLRAAASDPDYRRAVFFEPSKFTAESSLHQWGPRMLNFGATVQTWEQLLASPPDTPVFLRPNEDDKSFTGAVFAPGELAPFYESLRERGWVQPSDRIVVAASSEIDAEMRLFMVEGKVVSGSFYRPDASPALPMEVVAFVTEGAALRQLFAPARSVVLTSRSSPCWASSFREQGHEPVGDRVPPNPFVVAPIELGIG